MENYKIILTFKNTGARIEGCGSLSKAEAEQRIADFLSKNENFEAENGVEFSVEKEG